MKKVDQFKREVMFYTGSNCFFRSYLFPKYTFTEGVQFMAEMLEAFWLIDHVFANQTVASLKDEPFQVWKIKVNEDESARISVKDGNDNKLTFFNLCYTDFPLEEFTLWFTNDRLLLPGEY